jgi:hypothetical protein
MIRKVLKHLFPTYLNIIRLSLSNAAGNAEDIQAPAELRGNCQITSLNPYYSKDIFYDLYTENGIRLDELIKGTGGENGVGASRIWNLYIKKLDW